MAQEPAPSRPLEERVRALWDMSPRDLAAQAWKWPKAERAMLAQKFRLYWEGGKFGKPEGEQPYDILIQLGDRDATKRAVQKMATDEVHPDSGLRSSGSPIAIQYLAPYAFSQEPYKVIWAGDVTTTSLSFLVTNVIFDILSDSSAFTGEVVSWARRTSGPAPERRRAEFQRWWEENKIYFEQEDYKAVKPGNPIPNVIEVIDDPPRKAGLAPLEETRPKQSPLTTPSPMPQPVSVPVAQTPSAAIEGQAPIWPWVAGILALAVIALLALKRRAK